MTEAQWKRGGMVHLVRPDKPHHVFCGANLYYGKPLKWDRWWTDPGPEEHRCRSCKRLAAKYNQQVLH